MTTQTASPVTGTGSAGRVAYATFATLLLAAITPKRWRRTAPALADRVAFGFAADLTLLRGRHRTCEGPTPSARRRRVRT